jgi:hypothetical protein
MALPESGTLTFAQIATEFSGSQPYSLSQYYRGGSLVGANNTNVPTSGVISFSNFYGASAGITLTFSSNFNTVNLLSQAVGAGFNATTGGTLTVVINSGVIISGTAANNYAIYTDNFPANSIVTIINNGTVKGYTGAAGSAGNQGEGGGDAFYADFTASGSTWSIINNGTWGGGGGGGGGGASRSTLYSGKGGDYCDAPTYIGSAGAAGGLGEAGASGSNPSSGSAGCVNFAAGAGGAAGYAVRKNGLTISTTGTFLGTVG